MSYTRPAFDAANATWQGAEAYTRPASTVASASWVQGYAVSGLNSSRFGIHVVPLDVSGFQSSQFGTPASPVHVIADASGLSSSQFGTPSSVRVTYATGSKLSAFGTPNLRPVTVGFSTTIFGWHGTPGQTDSINSTQFGEPIGHSVYRVPSIGRTSQFGTHLLLNNDIVADAVHVGPSGFGAPYGYLITHPVRNIVAKAYTAGRSVFGTPSSPVDQSGDADGLRSTQFGTPSLGPMPLSRFGAHRSAQIQPAESLISTQFGDHVGAYGGRVSGLRSTMIGTPTYHRRHEVSGFSKSRFGIPSASQTGVHHVYGFRQTWFGHHKAIENLRHASGFSFSQFGAHDAHETRIVLHIPPTTRFGEHLMTRV